MSSTENNQPFKYHYSREERLEQAHHNVNEKKHCFICKKNIQMLIFTADIILVLTVIVLYNFMIGRSKAVSYDGGLYFYSKKIFGNFDTQNFVFQIKNNTKKEHKIVSTEAHFLILDIYGNEIYSDTFPITKKTLGYKESFIHTISFNKLSEGRYLTKLTLNNNPTIVFEMYFNSK